MSLIVVGSANMDLVAGADRLPRPGETVIGRSFATHPGGKGANQAVAAARLGGDVSFVGRVGRDSFGDSLRESLSRAGVRTSALQTDPNLPTGIALISVGADGQNSIVVVPGANAAIDSHLAAQEIGTDAVLLMQLEVPREAVCHLFGHTAARMKILNPAPAVEVPGDLFPLIDLITPNESEAESLTGIETASASGIREAAMALLALGARNVVITLGSQGCCYAGPDGCRFYEPWLVRAVDTVAAGDAFSGALALFLSQGRDMDRAIRLATVAAALSTTRHGAQESMPTLDDLTAAAGNIP